MTLQEIWNKYPNGTAITRGLDPKYMRYYAARDWKLADTYGTYSDERFELWPFRLISLIASRLPK